MRAARPLARPCVAAAREWFVAALACAEDDRTVPRCAAIAACFEGPCFFAAVALTLKLASTARPTATICLKPRPNALLLLTSLLTRSAPNSRSQNTVPVLVPYCFFRKNAGISSSSCSDWLPESAAYPANDGTLASGHSEGALLPSIGCGTLSSTGFTSTISA